MFSGGGGGGGGSYGILGQAISREEYERRKAQEQMQQYYNAMGLQQQMPQGFNQALGAYIPPQATPRPEEPTRPKFLNPKLLLIRRVK